MKIETLKSSVVLRLLLCCGIAVLSALVMRAVIRLNPFAAAEPGELYTQLVTDDGFKFEGIVNDPNLWQGPGPGSLLHTTNLEDQQQQPLAALVQNENVTMLLVVDRNCQVCSRSIEYIREVKAQLAQKGIKYCIISFKTDSSEDFFTYAKHLNVDAPSFMWAHRNAIVPSSLSLMIVPTHIAVDRQNRIRGIWPGGAEAVTLRSKMARQILSDIDVLLSEQKRF